MLITILPLPISKTNKKPNNTRYNSCIDTDKYRCKCKDSFGRNMGRFSIIEMIDSSSLDV